MSGGKGQEGERWGGLRKQPCFANGETGAEQVMQSVSTGASLSNGNEKDSRYLQGYQDELRSHNPTMCSKFSLG